MNPYRQRNDGGWCECAECHRTFGGLRGFDEHRVTILGPEYDWRCATDVELGAKGYAQDARGWWRSTRPGLPWASEGSTRTPVGVKNAESPEVAR